LLREQAVVTLALTPLSLLLFGQVSVVGLVANLLAIPWITLVVTPLALAGVLLPALWDFAAWTLGPLAALLGWLASLPFATVSMAAAPLWAGVAGVTGGVLLAARLPWGVRALGLPLLLPVLLWQAPRPARVNSNFWRPTSGKATRCSCAPPAMPWSTTPGRASPPRATPATACWCRCCARWTSGWTRWC
jgi:hypothetical protein